MLKVTSAELAMTNHNPPAVSQHAFQCSLEPMSNEKEKNHICDLIFLSLLVIYIMHRIGWNLRKLSVVTSIFSLKIKAFWF